MQTETTSEAARSYAERILTEMQGVREDLDMLIRQISILNDCAHMFLVPMEGDKQSPLQAMMRLLDLIVGGTEETHHRLEALNAALFDRHMKSALWAASEN